MELYDTHGAHRDVIGYGVFRVGLVNGKLRKLPVENCPVHY